MIQSSESSLRLNFGNLPLVEAVTRFTFLQPIQLTFNLINGLADAIKDDFPQLAELEELENPPGITAPMNLEVPKPLGAAYIGNRFGINITLHNHLLAARWRKQTKPNPPDYPRFPSLLDGIWKATEALQSIYHDDRLPIAIVNMVYVNLIHPKEPTSVLQDYFSSKVHVDEIKSANPLHEYMISWRAEELIDLRFRLQECTTQIGNEEKSGYLLSTAAGIKLQKKDNPKESLIKIHDQLQFFFRDLISDQAKEEWQFQEI